MFKPSVASATVRCLMFIVATIVFVVCLFVFVFFFLLFIFFFFFLGGGGWGKVGLMLCAMQCLMSSLVLQLSREGRESCYFTFVGFLLLLFASSSRCHTLVCNV